MLQENLIKDIAEVQQQNQKLRNCFAFVLRTSFNDMLDFNNNYQKNLLI